MNDVKRCIWSHREVWDNVNCPFFYLFYTIAGLKIVTATVANVTNIFSLVTKTSGLVAILVTRFLYDLDLN